MDRPAEIRALLASIYIDDPHDPPARYRAELLDQVKAVQAIRWLLTDRAKPDECG